MINFYGPIFLRAPSGPGPWTFYPPLPPPLDGPGFKDRQRLTKFRCSDHNLEIEVGRHKGIEVNDRQCQICDLNRVEDEAHFLCECPAYAAHREVLYKVTGINSTSNEAHFQDLMQSNEPSVIGALSTFLKEASDIRRNHLGQ